MAVVEGEGCQSLAALELTEDVGEAGAKGLGLDGVEDVAELGVARDGGDAEDGVEIGVGIKTALVEGEQRGVFESEESEAGHEGIGEGAGGLGAGVGEECQSESEGWRKEHRH